MVGYFSGESLRYLAPYDDLAIPLVYVLTFEVGTHHQAGGMKISSFFAVMTVMVEGFMVPPPSCSPTRSLAAMLERLNSRSSSRGLPEESASCASETPPLLSFNHSRANTTALAESKTPAGAYQITRPRWYNKAEVAIILLLVQRWVRD